MRTDREETGGAVKVVIYRSWSWMHPNTWMHARVIAEKGRRYLLDNNCPECDPKWIAKRRCIPLRRS
jgi:hypothetical protein